jgi:hypothetical protein
MSDMVFEIRSRLREDMIAPAEYNSAIPGTSRTSFAVVLRKNAQTMTRHHILHSSCHNPSTIWLHFSAIMQLSAMTIPPIRSPHRSVKPSMRMHGIDHFPPR